MYADLKTIRLTCIDCGFASEPARGYPSSVWAMIDAGTVPATTVMACSNCTANADYPDPEIMTTHFIDYPKEQP